MFGPAVSYDPGHPSLWQAAGETASVLLDAITACQRRGMVARGDVHQQACAAWSIVHGAALLYLDGTLPWIGLGSIDADQLGQLVTRALFTGQAARS
jgi:hypothetical protein